MKRKDLLTAKIDEFKDHLSNGKFEYNSGCNKCKVLISEIKQLNEDVNSIPSDIVTKMQIDFEPNPDTAFKQGMYSGYAFGLQDGYKYRSQGMRIPSDEEIEKGASEYRPPYLEYSERYNGFKDGAKWMRSQIIGK